MSPNAIRDSLSPLQRTALVGLALVVLVYGVLVLAGTFFTVGFNLVRLAAIVFVIYLFYRLVVAVELIAKKL